MSDNYAVINGKRVELTDEQLKALGIERKNPFERVNYNEAYYFVKKDGSVSSYTNANDGIDRMLYDATNYFNDKEFANQVALHQLLYRKLLKFAYDNGLEDNEWNDRNDHWYIFYSYADECFDCVHNNGFKSQSVYFSSPEGASRAIKEVVEPFVKEHPEFVW